MSQNTLRQWIILGICAVVVLITSIYRRGTADGQAVIGREENHQEATESEYEKETVPVEGFQIMIPGGNPKVRVLICTDHFAGRYHEKLTLWCSTDYTVRYGEVTEEHKASEPIWFTLDDPWLAQGQVVLTPKEKSGSFTIPELKRTQSSLAYKGIFTVEKREEGLLVVNELPLETYLEGVVPSEMPADYPMEALKAQAICARTYAMKQLADGRGRLDGADIDDSVSYQVYNNQAASERTDQAVRETAGQVLMMDGLLMDAYYYSTSCGLDLSQDLADEAVFCSAMTGSHENAYEKDEPWYRWKTYFSLEELTALASMGGQAAIGAVTGMEVAERETSGVIRTLEVSGEDGSFQIDGEYQIRKFLQTANAPVTLQDGSEAPDLGMLPSAFFYLTPEYEAGKPRGYTLTGGGYGHGNGMSQNGARHMAEAGKSCKDILKFYYAK